VKLGPMLGLGWLTLRHAKEALKGCRLDDAQRLLADPAVQGHKRTWVLLQELAHCFADRGEKHLRQDDVAAAWSDLLKAEQTGACEPAVGTLRQALTKLGLAEVRTLLEAGEPLRAVEAIALLRDRAVRATELELLDEAAKGWVLSREQADRGEFPQAIASMQRVQRLSPAAPRAIEKALFALHERQERFNTLLQELHDAATAERWGNVLRLTEEVLALAPQQAEARSLRTRAWKAVEPLTVVVPVANQERRSSQAEAGSGHATKHPDTTAGPQFHLWIDGVGGFLVCLGNRVTIGQATPESTAALAMLADISRLHAVLTRDSEGYMLEALRPAQVNGCRAEKTLLRDGDRITLGGCCQMQFRQAVPVSTSARLDIVSGHRLRLAVDGVLLMADTLVLGPGQHVHVQMPDLKQPLVLYRQKNGLGIRSPGAIKINGQSVQERGLLEPGASVLGDEFSFTLEAVPAASNK
jgi:hypothetical protein